MDILALARRSFLATPSRAHIILPLLFMSIIYWFSSLPGTQLPQDSKFLSWIFPIVQNLLHVPAYAALTMTLRWALRAWLPVANLAALGACAMASAYAVVDEWHQRFVSGRFASLADVMLDLAGVALGIWLYAWIESKVQSNSSNTRSDSIKPEA